MALKFQPAPFPFNCLGLKERHGLEALTADGKRIRVYVMPGEQYVIQVPNGTWPNGTPKVTTQRLSKDMAFALFTLLGMMHGVPILDERDRPYYESEFKR